jgi:hypothetical protein
MVLIINATFVEKPMRAESEDLRESMTKVDRKEWREPRLRRLPIAATANSTKNAGQGNDGGGGGKGEVQINIVS